jgi:hypothetical protein
MVKIGLTESACSARSLAGKALGVYSPEGLLCFRSLSNRGLTDVDRLAVPDVSSGHVHDVASEGLVQCHCRPDPVTLLDVIHRTAVQLDALRLQSQLFSPVKGLCRKNLHSVNINYVVRHVCIPFLNVGRGEIAASGPLLSGSDAVDVGWVELHRVRRGFSPDRQAQCNSFHGLPTHPWVNPRHGLTKFGPRLDQPDAECQ